VKNLSFNLLAILFLLFFSNYIISQEENKLSVHLKIIQTTDVHGAIFPFNFIQDKNVDYSLAQVHTYVKEERNNDTQEVILLDNGDILQGQPVVYYSNFEKPNEKHVCAAVMNYMRYDAATIGNHDIEAGHKVYDKLVKEYDFPWLAANAVDNKTNKPYFKPYHIIEKRGLKIAILGLITPAIPDWLPENIWEGMHFEDMIESAKKWVKHIKEVEKPDLLVGLFHAGVDHTYNKQTENTYKNENASKLVAMKVPGFDIVFAGHDHREYNARLKNDNDESVLLLDPGSHAKNVSVAAIDFVWDNNNKSFTKKIEGTLVKMSDYKPDSLFQEVFKKYYTDTYNYVNRVIGKSKKSFNAEEALFGNSEFMDFIQEVQMSIGKADVSFTSPLSFRFEIKEGDITVKDMFKLYRFENLLYTMKLSGQEIKNYLEYSADLWFNQMESENDALLKYTKDEDNKIRLTNPYYNYSSAAGIKYTVDVTKPYGKKITVHGFENGKRFDPNKHYRVAINSYRGNGGGGHLTRGAGIKKEDLKNRIVFSTEKDLRYYIIKYIEEKQIIDPIKRNNWNIVPESWWLKAKKGDYDLLFPAK
jgi:2',3'-cyclic-nucleotide 2'-phosphodiesterase/3'-nucleotidase